MFFAAVLYSCEEVCPALWETAQSGSDKEWCTGLLQNAKTHSRRDHGCQG